MSAERAAIALKNATNRLVVQLRMSVVRERLILTRHFLLRNKAWFMPLQLAAAVPPTAVERVGAACFA